MFVVEFLNTSLKKYFAEMEKFQVLNIEVFKLLNNNSYYKINISNELIAFIHDKVSLLSN